MSTLSLPTGIVPTSIDWRLLGNSQEFTSPLNGATQTASLAGDKWAAVLNFGNKLGTDAHKLRAFIASLDGRSGRFYVLPWDKRTPAGLAGGAPLVKGAGQSGKTLAVDGCTPNQTGWLLAGDYFQVGNELKICTADCNSSSIGEVTIAFAPALRVSPSDNSLVVTTDPKCSMKLADDNQSAWSANVGNGTDKLYGFTIAAIEAIDI